MLVSIVHQYIALKNTIIMLIQIEIFGSGKISKISKKSMIMK